MPPKNLRRAKLERAPSACRHAGCVKISIRTLLAEPRSGDKKETWATLVAKFPTEDNTILSAASAAAALASATELEDGNAPSWRPDDQDTSEMLFDFISSRSALSVPGNDGR